MGKAASLANNYREKDFFERYFSGSVLDIGAGADPVVAKAQIFDLPQGDANKILNYLRPETFDCVHSSHCLNNNNAIHKMQSKNGGWKVGGYLSRSFHMRIYMNN